MEDFLEKIIVTVLALVLAKFIINLFEPSKVKGVGFRDMLGLISTLEGAKLTMTPEFKELAKTPQFDKVVDKMRDNEVNALLEYLQ